MTPYDIHLRRTAMGTNTHRIDVGGAAKRKGITRKREREGMIRPFIIRDAKNKQGFDRFVVKQDNGLPYLENAEPISTNAPADLFRALAGWLEEGE